MAKKKTTQIFKNSNNFYVLAIKRVVFGASFHKNSVVNIGMLI